MQLSIQELTKQTWAMHTQAKQKRPSSSALFLAKDEEREISCSRGTTFICCYLSIATSVSTIALCLITEASGRVLLSPIDDFFSQLQGFIHSC
jgi:hypothetical protein